MEVLLTSSGVSHERRQAFLILKSIADAKNKSDLTYVRNQAY